MGLQSRTSAHFLGHAKALAGSWSSEKRQFLFLLSNDLEATPNFLFFLQPGDNPPALKPWGFSPTVEVVQPVVQQPQVVFLQPVVSRRASSASKEGSSRHRRPKNYLPILKSYPKIAPHPGDGSSSSGRGTASSSSSSSTSSSSSSSGSEKGSTQSCQRDKQQKGSGGASSLSPSAPALPSSPHPAEAGSASVREKPSSPVSQAQLISSSASPPTSVANSLPVPWGDAQESTQVQPDPSESSADIKRKRFCNTYNILSKSGLLDIALRTKELHRQNRRTQTDLDQLKEHTDLFLQALYSGDASICIKLQARLQEEGGERAAQALSKTDKS